MNFPHAVELIIVAAAGAVCGCVVGVLGTLWIFWGVFLRAGDRRKWKPPGPE